MLSRHPPGGWERPLAYALAAAVLFFLANAYPVFTVGLAGSEREALLISGSFQLTQYGGAMAALGILVALLSVVLPALRLTLTLVVLGGLAAPHARPHTVGSGPARPWLAGAWKAALALRPWGMLDVYLLGAFVAYSRLHDYVWTTIGVGGYALGALVVALALLRLSLGRQRVWDAIGDPAAYAPGPGEPWVMCPDCQLVLAAAPGKGRFSPRRCPRCAGRLDPRKRGTLAATAALGIAAAILYLPANLLPVLTIERFGQSDTNTILAGVGELIELGMWPLALLVFVASIVVPLLKLVSLAWFLIAIRYRSARLLRQRTALYRLVDFIGRWSNIDIFMMSLLVALMRFGALSSVEPGPGAVSFAAVVVLTMAATRSFDPRLMWDVVARERQ